MDAGSRQLGSQWLGFTFDDQQRRIACARVACLAAAILQGRVDLVGPEQRYAPGKDESLRDVVLRDPALNRLKGINPEAFHDWRLVEELLG